MAATKKSSPEADNVFVTENGRKIKLNMIDPIFIQSVVSSVKFPEVPTYEARTAHGNIEIHKMDEEAAKQTEGGEELWKKYKAEYDEASAKQTEITLRAMLLEGTERPKKDYIDLDWVRKMKILGISIPDDPDEAWIMYLQSSLTLDDLFAMTAKIMRLTGVDEEYVQEAEDSFRNPVLDESGEDDISDSE